MASQVKYTAAVYPTHLCHAGIRKLYRIAASGAGGGTTYAALQKADEAWLKLRTMKVSGAWQMKMTGYLI